MRLTSAMGAMVLGMALVAIGAAAAAQTLPQVSPREQLRPLTSISDRIGWHAVGRLETSNGFCTGTLIDAETVLTAAHCMFDPDGNRRAPGDLYFRAGLANGTVRAERRVAASAILPGYRNTGRADHETMSHDMALLRLESPIRMAEVQPFRANGDPSLGEEVTVVSYGAGRADVPSIEEGCEVLSSRDLVEILSCEVDPGTSGAPVLARRNGALQVVAVVSASAVWQDQDVSIATDISGRLGTLRQILNTGRNGATQAPAQVRLLGDGDTGRDSIGARFVRP